MIYSLDKTTAFILFLFDKVWTKTRITLSMVN